MYKKYGRGEFVSEFDTKQNIFRIAAVKSGWIFGAQNVSCEQVYRNNSFVFPNNVFGWIKFVS